MTRNLIAAKAWEGGRKNVCIRCIHFDRERKDIRGYEWQKCGKKSDEQDIAPRWEGIKCRYFELSK